MNGTLAGQGRGYVAGMAYGPEDLPLTWQLSGGTVNEKRVYNGLGQMTTPETKKGAALLLQVDLQYGAAGNNGNVLGQTIQTGTRTLQQYFGYL